MIKLSEIEKKELQRLSKSKKLREDNRIIQKNTSVNQKKIFTLDDYIIFLNTVNKFANHPKKVFKKITGNHFCL